MIKRGKTDQQVLQLLPPSCQTLQLLTPRRQALRLNRRINMLLPVASTEKKKYTKKTPSLCSEEWWWTSVFTKERQEAESEIITWSLLLSELWDTQKDFSCYPSEDIVIWLLWHWLNWASSLELEDKEAKHLGPLSREGSINKVIGKKTEALRLWQWLLSGVKKSSLFQEDVPCHPG